MSSQSIRLSSSSQSVRSASSAQSSFVASSSSSPTSTSISPRSSSSLPATSSALSSSRLPSASAKIPAVSASSPHQSLPTSFSSTDLPSGSISPSSPSQIPSHAAIADTKATPLSHRPGIIAAIAASIVAVLVILLIVYFLCRRSRRRTRQMQVGSSTSQQPFMQEHPPDRDAKPRPWNDRPATGSTTGSGWPDYSELGANTIPLQVQRQTRRSVASLPGAGKTPHYTVRSHASMTDVYGFGQDLAWQEAHYEDPLPAVPPPPLPSSAYPTIGVVPSTPRSEIIPDDANMPGAHYDDPFSVVPPPPTHPPSAHPTIGVVPPTPRSDIVHHDVNMPGATSLLRSPSAASTVSSAYSTASMVLPEPSMPPHADIAAPAVIHDRSLTDDRDWIVDSRQNTPPEAQPRRLI